MKKIIINDYNLKEEDMTEVVKRVKVLLINSKNEVLLGYSNNDYQCPGGHVENGENYIDTINREIEEETGIKLNIKEAYPFACVYGYYKDWPSAFKNRKIEIYYYEIKTDEEPNLENTKYTENEKKGNFELRCVPLDCVEEEFINNAKKHGDKYGIVREMLKVFEIYKSIK